MPKAYHLIPFFLITFAVGCTHLQEARESHRDGGHATENSSPEATVKAERGTLEEAKAMLQKAVEHYNSVGRNQALADFTQRKPPFYDRDLYVFCISTNGRTVANGGFPQYVGTSADALKDAEGKPLGRRIIEVGSGSGEGSVEYTWLNPVSHKMEHKIAFAKKVGDDICGVGAYNPN